MKLDESAVRILERYKYSNVGLEQTMEELAKALGYLYYRPAYSGEYAGALCDYKWNKLTKGALILRILDSNYLQSTPLKPIPLDWKYGSV